MNKIKIGVIGTGHLGKLHTKLFREVDNCELIGIYDLDFERAKSIANEFGTTAFEIQDDLLKKVDAVSIVATTTAHFELVKNAFEKNIFVSMKVPFPYPFLFFAIVFPFEMAG